MSIKLDKIQEATKAEVTTSSNGIWELLNRDIKLFGSSYGAKQKEAFYTELEALLKAGLDIKAALELLQEGATKKKEQQLYQSIQESIISGSSLSEAMQQSKKFSEYEYFSIRIAEESGNLPPVLRELAQYFARILQYRRLLISALSYPILVIGVSIFALAFLLNFLVPIFSGLYERLGQSLPPLTEWIIQLSDALQSLVRPAGIILLGVSALMYWQKKAAWFRKSSAAVMLYIPIFGTLIHQIYLARFCQAMAFLMQAHVPVLQAIGLAQKMVRFYPIEQALEQVQKEIFDGIALHQSLSQFRIFPRRLIALIRVGEEANQLGAMFGKLASQYNEGVEQRTKLVGSLIEPVIIVFLALVVGLILVAMYLPIFKLVTNFGL
jgi:type IV pilus assembly protein PilC